MENNNDFEHLKLENQLCFLLYAASREMTKQYKTLLENLNVTYPQYLVLLLLWEHERLTVKGMGEMLFLDSGTLTPMLKRMEEQGLIVRERSSEDQRSVFVTLTENGQSLKQKAADIPERVFSLAGNDEKESEILRNSLLKLLHNLQSNV
ncbi:MarR family winged helix-turn-helix transcriptional regulator [Bacillus salacetis]|uniref:MarR family winged helix-turn-helix transcriptional regulator n=1 Tax=Bacillus salacetis TaxID=2315464 RepID=UPI003BA35EF9